MIKLLNQQFGLGAVKATSGAVVAASVTQIPGVEAILHALAGILSLWLDRGLTALGATEPVDSTAFWSWCLVAAATYITVYLMRNRQPPPAKPEGDTEHA